MQLILDRNRKKRILNRINAVGIINETEVINAFHEPATSSQVIASTKSKRHNCYVIMRILICQPSASAQHFVPAVLWQGGRAERWLSQQITIMLV